MEPSNYDKAMLVAITNRDALSGALNVYSSNSFSGIEPTNTAAVVVAATPEAAKVMLEARLAEIGIPQTVPLEDIVLVDVSRPSVIILSDGNY